MDNKENKSPYTLLIGLACTIWLVIALVGYYYTHKPITIEILSSLLIILWRLVVAAGILTLSGGLGTVVLAKFKGIDLPPLTTMAVQSALGAGVLGLVILLVGFTLGIKPLYFGIILLGGFALLGKPTLNWLKQWASLKSCFSKNPFIILLALGCGLLLFWSLGFALAPPFQFDALTYHLALPRWYLLSGNLNYTPDNMFWGMPQKAEMLYTFAMALGGAEAAVVVGWGLGLLTLASLLEYVTQKFNLTAGWVAVTCLLAGSSLVRSLSSGYIEWLLMLDGLATLVVLVEWRKNHKTGILLLAGGLAGFALGAKYTAGQLILIGLVIIAWDGIQNKDRRTLLHLLLFGATATLVSSPWWVKNWLATSNPFYPLLWPAGAMTQARLDMYRGTPWGTWPDMLILPWQVTVWGVEGASGFSWSIGPLLLGFGALAWFGWHAWTSEQKRLISSAGLAALTGFIVWAVANHWNGLLNQSRLYTAFFPAWAMLAAAGFDSLSNLRAAGIRFGRIAMVIVLLVFTFNLIEIGEEFVAKAPLAVLSGNITPASYRIRSLGSYEAAMQSLEALPPGAHVLMLWETRSLACLPACDPDEVIDRWYDDVHKYSSAEETLSAWQAQGYTHLLLNRTGQEFVEERSNGITPEDWERLDTLLGSLPPPETVGGGYELYDLR